MKEIVRKCLPPACLVLGLALAVARPAPAEIYRQVRPDGSVVFTDTPLEGDWQLYFSRENSIYDIIDYFARLYGLDEALIRAVIKVESDFEPEAVSRKGAMGMMQLIPGTAAELDVVNPLDVVDNIRGGSRYLRRMLDMFDNDLDLALAAYNAGPSAVRRYGGIPPYPETQRYVRKVRHYFEIFRQQTEPTL
ncbi:soluble lytic murein transglycosylase [Geothermobacter ehrlichii]|uniref:Soluble lytic murein transglycosylase n=1 Tax=Geothermobacter ehrlichii TaxID=213224 RepID=A0A5D3WRY2_9BACT|nr:lytic transglycosylase domain-containing protein [Geothermobacter ehrlichii]TYP00349.1 soluble lytic murein transglycosylase [Geothermobacter ehrlichii]